MITLLRRRSSVEPEGLEEPRGLPVLMFLVLSSSSLDCRSLGMLRSVLLSLSSVFFPFSEGLSRLSCITSCRIATTFPASSVTLSLDRTALANSSSPSRFSFPSSCSSYSVSYLRLKIWSATRLIFLRISSRLVLSLSTLPTGNSSLAEWLLSSFRSFL
jgi:hypothetical protein